jgi:hypothetical protein
MKLPFYLFCLLISAGCSNQPVPNQNAVSKNTIAGTHKTNDSSKHVDEGVEPELADIVSRYLAEYKNDHHFDTTLTIGNDVYRIVFKHTCTFDSAVILPAKYVSLYGLQQFVTHNFTSIVSIYKNNSLVVERHITKDLFRPQAGSSLAQYGVLLYPDIKILNKSFLRIDYSLSIPLTDVGHGVNVSFTKEGVMQL